MLTVTVGGHSLREFGPHEPVRFTTTHRGSGTASWRMVPGRHRSLDPYRGALTYISSGGFLLWGGVLDEPGPGGEYHASGLPVLADQALALNATGDPTADEYAATTQAIARGVLPGWVEYGGMGVWTGEPQPGTTLTQLYDDILTPRGARWRVEPRGTLTAYGVGPGAPDWHVRLPSYRYGWTSEGLVSTVTGQYMPATGVYDDVTIRTGVVGGGEEWVDLTGEGLMTAVEAEAALWGIVETSGAALPAPTERVEIGPGALLSRGFTAVPSYLIAGGDTLRIWGATDGQSGARHLDVRVDGTDYDDETRTAVVTPANAAPRGFAAALETALSA